MTATIILIKALIVLVLSFVGVTAILTGTKVVPLTAVDTFFATAGGMAFLISIGSVFIVIGGYFILALYRVQAAAARFTQDGARGKIELSPAAVREFISVILRREIGVDRFRVRLRHMEDGIGIQVETTLSADQEVAAVSRKIQDILADRVEERTGVAVHDVSVLVRSIRTSEPTSKPETGDETDQ